MVWEFNTFKIYIKYLKTNLFFSIGDTAARVTTLLVTNNKNVKVQIQQKNKSHEKSITWNRLDISSKVNVLKTKDERKREKRYRNTAVVLRCRNRNENITQGKSTKHKISFSRKIGKSDEPGCRKNCGYGRKCVLYGLDGIYDTLYIIA